MKVKNQSKIINYGRRRQRQGFVEKEERMGELRKKGERVGREE